MDFNDIQSLSLDDLRNRWAKEWGKSPHGLMGRKMMIESLKFKQWGKDTGGLTSEQQSRLNDLIKAYKRNPDNFDNAAQLKLGTRLVRKWKGEKYCVTAVKNGFDYDGEIYSSLSQIANTITGSRWNGWLFFGLKK